MLPKKNRLTVFQFNQIPQKSKDLENFHLVVKLKNNGGNCPKFTIIIPKFLDKRSSYRHLTKRAITEALRGEIKKIKIPISVMIKAKKILKKQDSQYISNQLKILLKKANVL